MGSERLTCDLGGPGSNAEAASSPGPFGQPRGRQRWMMHAKMLGENSAPSLTVSDHSSSSQTAHADALMRYLLKNRNMKNTGSSDNVDMANMAP